MTPQEIQNERNRLQAWLADQINTHTTAKRNVVDHVTKHEAEYLAVIARMKTHRDQMALVADEAIKSAQDHVTAQMALLADAERVNAMNAGPLPPAR